MFTVELCIKFRLFESDTALFHSIQNALSCFCFFLFYFIYILGLGWIMPHLRAFS